MGLDLKKIFIFSLILLWAGCTPRVVYRPAPPPRTPAPPQPSKTPEDQTIPDWQQEMPGEKEKTTVKKPRELASLQLTDQARLLLDSDRPDDAIRILERAVNLHPQNGEAYYYLAEAWLKKGNVSQAQEYHDLAAIYLGDERKWSEQLRRQEISIKHY